MASSEKEPPDRARDRFYKCHPNQKVSAVVCIICESIYHISDFKKLNNIKYVSDTLVICPEHTEANITLKESEIDLNEHARYLIAQIKLQEKEEIRKEVLNEASINVNKTRGMIEAQKQKTEIQPLNKTFAETVVSIKTKPKRVPKLFIKKTVQDPKVDLKQLVTQYLIKEKTIQTKRMHIKNEDEIIIECMNEESINVADKLLNKKLPSTCNIKKETIKNPVIKIVGIENFSGISMDEIVKDINERNFKNYETKCKGLNSYNNEKTKTTSIYLEVTSALYKHIADNKFRLFVGYQNCRVYDSINVKPCYKCGRYGHNYKKCLNDETCLRCAGNHPTGECNERNPIKCVNCTYMNAKYNKKYNDNHTATDWNKCEVLKRKIGDYVDTTDYPYKPTLPTFDGKIPILRERTTRETSTPKSATTQAAKPPIVHMMSRGKSTPSLTSPSSE